MGAVAGHCTSWSSRNDLAAKALRKLAGPHVPASLTKLEQAIKRAHNAHAKAERAYHEQQHAARDRDETQVKGETATGADPLDGLANRRARRPVERGEA